MKNTILILMSVFLTTVARSQNTDTIQTFTYNDIYNRRDTFQFPDGSASYEKVLMLYKLKCDPQTPYDNYDCGEWDYLTYSFIHDHRGIYDSTYKNQNTLSVNGQVRDTFPYRTAPTYTYFQDPQTSIIHNATNSYTDFTVGGGSTSSNETFMTSENSGKAVYIFTAAELTTAGMTAGDISGIQLDVSGIGSEIKNLTIKMGHTTNNALDVADANIATTTVYHHNTTFSALGIQDLQFTQNFTWNGTDNVVLEFSYDNASGTTDNMLNMHDAGFNAGIFSHGDEFTLHLDGGEYVNLGSEPQVNGNNPRTYEAWVYQENQNDGGVFQAGKTGTQGEDFSFRSTGTADLWRAQMWGNPDFDVTLTNSFESWHHVAMVYDGSTVKIFYDGNQVGQNNVSINTPLHDIFLGRWNNARFGGKIDDFRAWDVALPANVIQDWMYKDIDASHPNYANLKGYYQCNEGTGFTTSDSSPNGNQDGNFVNDVWWYRIKGEDKLRNFQTTNLRPNIVFERGDYNSTTVVTNSLDSIENAPDIVVEYLNPGSTGQIVDNDPNHPTIPTDTNTYYEADRYMYVYHAQNGSLLDSVWVDATDTLTNTLIEWYSNTVRHEIARFITPYGIGFDLGQDGFTWVFDVTDYQYLLEDMVDIQAHNTQELIDLKFVFVEGTPPRDVVKVDRLWDGMASYSYESLVNDNNLTATNVAIDPNAEMLKIKTRITGHGHQPNTNQTHCCEWFDIEHRLHVNGSQHNAWSIWRECATNPNISQGGTWPYDREGWCPGDKVPEYEFDLSEFAGDNQISIDYEPEDVLGTYPGFAQGNFVMNFDLVQYGAPNFQTDATIKDILNPTDKDYYSNFNPTCQDPVVVLQNTGANTMTSARIIYWVGDANYRAYEWSGNLEFLEEVEVTLPVDDYGFWYDNNGLKKFRASVDQVNGQADEYAQNNYMSVDYETVERIDGDFVIWVQENNNPSQNSYYIKDHAGNVVFSRENMQSDAITEYKDTISGLDPGCYTFEFYDAGDDGISFWASNETSGFVRLRQVGGSMIEAFNGDFGRYIKYGFTVGFGLSNEEIAQPQMKIYPNPTSSDFVNLELDNFSGSSFDINIYNAVGQHVKKETIRNNANQYINTKIDVSMLTPGVYWIKLIGDGVATTEQLVIQ